MLKSSKKQHKLPYILREEKETKIHTAASGFYMLLLSWYTFSELWLVANLLKYESWFGWKRVGEQSARSPQTISCYTEIIQRTPRKLGLLLYFLLVLFLTSSNCFIFFHFRKCAAGLCWTTSAIWLHGTPDKWISPKQGHAWVFLLFPEPRNSI